MILKIFQKLFRQSRRVGSQIKVVGAVDVAKPDGIPVRSFSLNGRFVIITLLAVLLYFASLAIVSHYNVLHADSHWSIDTPSVEVVDNKIYLKVAVSGEEAVEFRALRDDHWPSGVSQCSADVFVRETISNQYGIDANNDSFNGQYWHFAINEDDHGQRYCFKAVGESAGALYVLSEPVFIDDTQLASLQYKLLAVNGQRAKVSVVTDDEIIGWKVFAVSDFSVCQIQSYEVSDEVYSVIGSEKSIDFTYRDDLNYCFWAMREHDYLLTVTYYIPGQVLHEHRLRRTLTANYSIAVRDGQLTVSLEEPDVLGWRIIKVSSDAECTANNLSSRAKFLDTNTRAQSISFAYEEGVSYCAQAKRQTDSLHFIFRYIAADTIRSLRVDPEDIITTFSSQTQAGNIITIILQEGDALSWKVIAVENQTDCNEKEAFDNPLVPQRADSASVTIQYDPNKNYCFWPVRATDDIEFNYVYLDRAYLNNIPAPTNNQPVTITPGPDLGVISVDEKAPVVEFNLNDGLLVAEADEAVAFWSYVIIAENEACDEFSFEEGPDGVVNQISLPEDLSAAGVYCFQATDVAGNNGYERYQVVAPEPESGPGPGPEPEKPEKPEKTESKTEDPVEGETESSSNRHLFILIGIGTAVIVAFGITLYAINSKNRTIRF